MSKISSANEPRFWWHWQNLKEDNPKAWLHGRAWLHRRPRGDFGIEWCVPSHSFGVSVTVGGNDQLRLSFACGLFALYMSFEQWPFFNHWKAANDYPGKETSFSIHNWSLWWELWHDEHEWKSTDPKWRSGSFNIPDFLFGRAKYTKVDQEPIPAIVSLTEGDYPVTVAFFTETWKRPRWPGAKVRTGSTVDIEQGIPIPGKGESAWDCDDDAFMSIGTSATTVEEAIADAITSVNVRRMRYGGKNWLPDKSKEKS